MLYFHQFFMKLSSSAIFYLIQSMNKSEKRYFKLFATQQSDDNVSIYLFDEIAKQERYDEVVLKEKAKKQKIRYFQAKKQYLYQLVLKSLVAYNADKLVDVQLKTQLSGIEVLIGKKLFTQASVLITKIKETAAKYEKYALYLEAIRLEKIIWASQSFVNTTQQDLVAINTEESEIVKKMVSTSNYWQQTQILFKLIYQEEAKRDKKYLENIDAIATNALFVNEELASTFLQKFYLYGAKYQYYNGVKDYVRSYHYLLQMTLFTEEFPHWISYEPLNHVKSLNNLLELSFSLNNLSSFNATFFKLQHFTTYFNVKPSEELTYEIALRKYDQLSNYYIHTLDFETLFLKQNEILSFITENKHHINEHILKDIMLKLIFAAFGSNHLKQVIMLVNMIENEYDYLLKDLHGTRIITTIVILLTHVELGNIDLVESKIGSLQRYLTINLHKDDVQFKLVLLVKQIIKNEYKASDVFVKSINDITAQLITSTLSNKKYLILLTSYLTSKIENRPFAEVVREKHQKKLI